MNNIEELLKQVKKVKKAQDAGEVETTGTESNIPQNLTPDPKNRLPKNIVAESEQGDPEKIEALLNAIAEDEATKGASEALLTAKLAEEVAAQDQEIICKQAELFGAVMADAMLGRIERVNQVTEKEASEAADAQAQSWYDAGSIMATGYLDKLAEALQEEATGGVINETAAPAVLNQDEEAEIDEDTLNYIATEMARDIAAQEEGADAPKNASEKEAGTVGILAHHIRNLLAGGAKGVRTAGGALASAGKTVARSGGTASKAVGNAMTSAGRYTKANPAVVGGGAIAAGAGYTAGRLQKKESSERSIIDAYINGEIDVKSAAEALRPAK